MDRHATAECILGVCESDEEGRLLLVEAAGERGPADWTEVVDISTEEGAVTLHGSPPRDPVEMDTAGRWSMIPDTLYSCRRGGRA